MTLVVGRAAVCDNPHALRWPSPVALWEKHHHTDQGAQKLERSYNPEVPPPGKHPGGVAAVEAHGKPLGFRRHAASLGKPSPNGYLVSSRLGVQAKDLLVVFLGCSCKPEAEKPGGPG